MYVSSLIKILPYMHKQTQTDANGPKWAKTDQNGPKWTKIDQYVIIITCNLICQSEL